MTPAARKPATPPPPPPPGCSYPIGGGECGEPSTRTLPVGYASNSQPMPLCGLHAARFLGATTAIP